jgi:DNA-binding protein HU-beta
MAACRRGYAGKLTDQWQLLRFHDGNCRRMAASRIAHRARIGPRRSRLARANRAAYPLLGVQQQTTEAQDRNKTVQTGLVLDFSARIPTIVLNRKPGQDNMSKMMTKSELIQKITDQHSDLTKKDVKAVMETLATVGYKELKKTGAFLLPGFAKFVVIKKPATKERAGINPFTKEPTVFKARPARKIIKARPVKAAKDAV